MHIFFSGIGGAAIGPLAMIAHQAGYTVSGSDQKNSAYIDQLKSIGIKNVTIGQTTDSIANVHDTNSIDWLVFSSAVLKENPDHPELTFAREHGIKFSKRDEFINQLLTDTGQKMIAIAGTHGKTTTTAMAIWLLKQLGEPVSYSVGAKLSFGNMGEFDPSAEYFVYEADEYDRNFLSFTPYMSLITGIAYDHPDVYPSPDEYNDAFRQFIVSSEWTIAHPEDLSKLNIQPDWNVFSPDTNLEQDDFQLIGQVNRANAQLVVQGISEITKKPYEELVPIMNDFPGVSRRFEKIADNIYSDYAHTPEKITGAIQIALESKDEQQSLILVYEGLHNTRQHFIKESLKNLFADTDELIIVPSYRAREDESLEDLTPKKLCQIVETPTDCHPAQLDGDLKTVITKHAHDGNLVLCLSAGGGGSLDEWLRKEFGS